MLSSEQVLVTLAKLQVEAGDEPNERWLVILNKNRGLREGDVNKLTISKRVEFYHSSLVSATTPPNLLIQSQLEPDFDRVRMWGWLDTESEVEEIRFLKRINGAKWEVGTELVW